MKSVYHPPVMENLANKQDALDWDTLPLGECDLNYRPSTGHPENMGLFSWGIIVVVAALSVPFAAVLPQILAPAFSSQGAFVAFLLLGAVAALGFLVFKAIRPDPKESERLKLERAAWILLVPTLFWIVLVSSQWHSLTAGSVLLYCALAVPMLVWLADSVATHALYWMSANPQIDHAAMLGWRTDWSNRWGEIPARKPSRVDLNPGQQTRHAWVLGKQTFYRQGPLWLALSIVVPSIFVLTLFRNSPKPSTGFALALALLASLAVAALVRNFHNPDSFRLSCRFLYKWFTYGVPHEYPPWVFTSPAGSCVRRQTLVVAAVFLLSVTFLPLADYFQWIYLAPLDQDVTTELAESSNWAGNLAVLFQGNSYAGLSFLFQILLLISAPVVILLLAVFLLAGPVIAAHHDALEAANAYEKHREWDLLDGYSERLRNSRNPHERESIFKGRHPIFDYPILIHTDLIFEHVHILGATGAGKTVLGLITDTIQLIRRNDGPVVILDCKGDMAFFNTVRLEAHKANRKFKWLTNKPNRSTYVLNPFDRTVLSELTVAEVVGLLINAMNLHHGSDYGRAWFSIASRILMKRSIEETIPNFSRNGSSRADRSPKFGVIESFRDLNEIILYLAADGKDYQSAQHLACLVESLADYEQLNLAANRNPDHPALRHAISMPEVVREKQVIYLYLTGATDIASVAEIARLALYLYLTACMQHKDKSGETPRAYCICDEAQAVIGQNIAQVLAQARSHGLGCILAHQTMSQLNPPGGVDLRELVMSCTSVKQVFSARDPWLQKYLADMSGRVRYATHSYDQDPSDIASGLMGIAYAMPDKDGNAYVRVTETAGPRLTSQDILDYNRNDNLCMLAIERAKGFSRWNGFAPVYVDWPMREHEYVRRRDDMPWPAPGEETISIQPDWPEPGEETIVAGHHPPLVPVPGKDLTEARLQEIRRQIEEE